MQSITISLSVPDSCAGAFTAGGRHIQGTSAANTPHVPSLPVCVWGGWGRSCIPGARGVGACVAMGVAHSHTSQTVPPGMVVLPHTVCHLHYHLGQEVINNMFACDT